MAKARPGAAPAERLADVVQETGQVKQEMRTLASGALTLYSIIQHSIASTIEGLGLGNLPMLANVQKRKAWLAIKIPSNSMSGALVGEANKTIAANHPLWSTINKG